MVIFSSVNPYVGARYPVHCSCCDSEVKPAITIESGHAVKAISLVEAVDPPNEAKTTTVTIKEIDNDIEVSGDSNEPQTMNMLSNAVDTADHAGGEDKTTTPMNITIKEAEAIVENTGETEIETPATVPIDGDELDTSNVNEVRTTYMVPPNVCRNIRLALDKARFCLQKINCTTTKRFQELSREQNEHIIAIKTLATESLVKHDSGIVEGLYFINQELIKSMEHLKEKMLDCQQTSLLDIIDTLKQDVGTEFSSLEQFDVQENKLESEKIVETSKNYSLITFLRDSSWTLFGFTSLLVANLGYFSQPLLSQSFHNFCTLLGLF